MSVTLKPLGDRIIIQLPSTEGETVTAGGLLIVEDNKKKPQRGIVVSVSEFNPNNDGVHVPIPLKPGQAVLYNEYAGINVPGAEDLLCVRIDDIIAVEV